MTRITKRILTGTSFERTRGLVRASRNPLEYINIACELNVDERKLVILKVFTAALGAIFLCSVTGYAQTPTLSLAANKVGISSNESGRASNFEFQMEASGWPRAVTAGETIFMMGSWPNGNNPTITDDKSNTWRSATSCNDSGGMNHGFFYAINAAANTSMITETHRLGN